MGDYSSGMLLENVKSNEFKIYSTDKIWRNTYLVDINYEYINHT